MPDTKSNGCVFLRILMIKKPDNVNKVTLMKNNWSIIVEGFIGMKFSNVYDTKDGIIEPICKRFGEWGKLPPCKNIQV